MVSEGVTGVASRHTLRPHVRPEAGLHRPDFGAYIPRTSRNGRLQEGRVVMNEIIFELRLISQLPPADAVLAFG